MPSTMAKRPQSGSEWPARLKRLRERRGLTQAEAAKLVGVSRRAWIAWEQGDQVPSRPVQILIGLLEKSS